MKSRTTSQSRSTQHSKQHSTVAAVSQFMDGTMVVDGRTYYHARVVHHHSWRAADSTV